MRQRKDAAMPVSDEQIRQYLDSIIYIETVGLTRMEDADASDHPFIERFIDEELSSLDFDDLRDCINTWTEIVQKRNGDLRSVMTCALSEFYGYHWRMFLQRLSADADDEMVDRLEKFAKRPLAFIPVFNTESQ